MLISRLRTTYIHVMQYIGCAQASSYYADKNGIQNEKSSKKREFVFSKITQAEN